MALHVTPENIRAEISRHLLVRRDIADEIQMNPRQLTNYVNGTTPLPGWAAHNLGLAINILTGMRIFDIDPELGYLRPKLGRPPLRTRQWGMGLEPYESKRKKRLRRAYLRRQREKAQADE